MCATHCSSQAHDGIAQVRGWSMLQFKFDSKSGTFHTQSVDMSSFVPLTAIACAEQCSIALGAAVLRHAHKHAQQVSTWAYHTVLRKLRIPPCEQAPERQSAWHTVT